ncbi:MAG TPA: undecaprenyl-diphosphate phosphatase [Candidatus Marinimicrobia bacterium]|nr:undecaprenyl-diphosphate phosphatase [Candidatus Neomarinimicrobiota bacterium]
MTYLEVIVISVVQGLTEFLPVSSSGHLVLTSSLFSVHEPGITLEIALHFGTFMSVLVVFWKDIMNILTAFFSQIWKISKIPENYRNNESFRISLLVIISMIPAMLAGLFLRDMIEGLFKSVQAVGIALIVTGILLFFTQWAPRLNKRPGIGNIVLMGIFQAFALIPGISRSGSTITAGLLAGLDREKVAKLSFIMALPLIVGATIMEVPQISHGEGVEIFKLLLGMIIAFVSGIFALKWLIRILIRGRLSAFSYYCVLLGFLTVALNS